MQVDLHVHFAAEPPQGELSARFRRSFPFQLLQRTVARGPDPAAALRERLISAAKATALDGVVVLALDRPHSEVGLPLAADLHVSNATVAALRRETPKILLGASVHPYRPDALEALEEAVALGAVLLKWLPNAQRLDPASPKCDRFYRRLVELSLPLLSHTGDEHTLPHPAQDLGDIRRLQRALDAGVTVIAAHAGTGGPASPTVIAALVQANPRLFLECSALWTPHRFRQMRALLRLEALRAQWVYGSDWPVPLFWPLRSPALRASRSIPNDFDRRVQAALALGVPEEAFTRGASLLRR